CSEHVASIGPFLVLLFPIFLVGVSLILVVHVTLGNPWARAPLFPGGGMYTLGMPFSLLDRIYHLALPVGMLAVANAATYTRYTRASMLEVIGQDFIRTARAKGTPEPRVIWKHGLKNAASPVVTILALDLPALFAGAVFTETMFSW